MVLRRGNPYDPSIPPGFVGDRRMLAAVVRAALNRAGYECHFLNQEGSGLSIGTSGTRAIAVGSIGQAKPFTWNDAQKCAAMLNMVFQRIVPTAKLATPVHGKTNIGNVHYAEVEVACSSKSMLRALRRALIG